MVLKKPFFYVLFCWYTSFEALTTSANTITATQIADSLFNPKSMPFPTSSINQASVIELYGPSGLNVGEPLLTYIQKFYFYLEYLTRMELAAQLLVVAQENNINEFSQAVFSWNDLVSQVLGALKNKNITNVTDLIAYLRTIKNPNFTNFQQALDYSLRYDFQDQYTATSSPAITFELLQKSSFWTAFTLAPSDLALSNFWQEYIKFALVGTFQIDTSLSNSITFNQNLIFKYIPKIETSYYTDAFTTLRTQSELLRVSLVLNENYRNRLIKQLVPETSTDTNGTSTTIDWTQLKADELYTYLQGNPQTTNGYNFTATDFYKYAKLSTDLSTINDPDSPFTAINGIIQLKPSITMPSGYPEYMTALGMIMTLQQLTYALFEPTGTGSDALTQTVTILKNITNPPTPSLLIYDTEDFLPLEDLTTIIKVTPSTILTSTPATNESVTTQSLSASERVKLASFFGDIWNDIKTTAEDTWATVKDAANVAVDEAEVLYYSSGMAEALQGVSVSQAAQASQEARDAATNDWTKLRTDADTAIADAVQLAVYPGETIITAVLDIVDKGLADLGLPEADLATDFATFLDATAAVLTDALTSWADFWITQGEGLVKLSVDGIALISKVAIDIASGQFKDIPSDLSTGLFNIINDGISTMLESITVLYEDISKLATDVLNLIGSFVQIITNLLIDLYTFYVLAGSELVCYGLGANCDPTAIASTVGTFLDNHKNTISQIVTTGLLIGATVATGGGALAVGMMGAFGVFAIAGGYQQDTASIDLRAEQTEFLENYTTYIVNRQKIDTQTQKFISDELSAKFAAEINNRERSLGFYQNYLNDTLTSIRDQLNTSLGVWQAALLEKDNSQLSYADIGSIYGITTNFTDLNIGQGFSLYSLPRRTIAQEIAETPNHTPVDPTTVSSNTLSQTKFWFNQRITTDFPQEINPFEVEVKFQTFYLLDNYYVGLYIGGQPLDTDAIINQNIGNLDQPRFAKMFVYSKASKESPTTLGLFEYESQQPNALNNWLLENINGPTLNPGTWYHMKASLNKDSNGASSQLQLKIWQDGTTEPNWQVTQAVTPSPQQTFGMIFSGAAGEFEVISPQTNFSINTTVRPPLDASVTTEQQRELNSMITMNRLLLPQDFSSFSLAPLDKNEIIKGHYLYSLTQGSSQDIVTTATKNSVLENIGQKPSAASNALVSLISGKGYAASNTQLIQQAWAQNISSVYQSTFQNLSDTISKQIADALTNYSQTLMGDANGFTFGSYTVTPVSLENLKNHQFVYITTDPTKGPILTNTDGTALTDSSGAQIYDNYFIFTLKDATNPSPDFDTFAAGMSYQDVKALATAEKPLCMVSLITGNVYIETQPNPIGNGYIWDNYINGLNAELKNTITTIYAAIQQANIVKKPIEAPTENTISQPSTGGTGDSSTVTFGGFSSDTTPTDSSFNERQTEASGI